MRPQDHPSELRCSAYRPNRTALGYRPAMRALPLVFVAAVAAVVPSAAVVGAAHAKPAQPRAELVSKSVTGSLSNGQVTVSAKVKNKGDKSAKPSQTAFYLSTDKTQSKDDVALGAASVGKVRPKKSKSVAGTFALPTGLAGGTYRVLACADSGNKVKERKENNNCKASKGSITLVVTVSASAGTGGTVAASAVTGGTCSGTVCTFPTPGSGTVTFTPTAGASYRFGAWTGPACAGFTAGAGNTITFSKPTTSRTCTATFVKQVTISWTVSPGAIFGAMTTTASNGTCTATDPITATGSCVVDAGLGTVELTAVATIPGWSFSGWSGATCNGTSSANKMTFTSPTEDKACTATFSL